MRITLIQLDQTGSRLADRFERYPAQFQTMFAAAGANFEWNRIDILDGAPFPDPAGLEAILITGSKYGVYDSPAWIEPLRAFIRAAYAAKTPMLGICFGHQIMADALGGDVRLAPNGWQLGRQHYHLIDPPAVFDGVPAEIDLLASHQDQVLAPPATAKTFLASPGCPHAGLVYENGAALSLQPHPEFSRDYTAALVGLRAGDPLPADKVAALVDDIAGPVDDLAVGRALLEFLDAG